MAGRMRGHNMHHYNVDYGAMGETPPELRYLVNSRYVGFIAGNIHLRPSCSASGRIEATSRCSRARSSV